MILNVRATWDGSKLVLEEPLPLEPGARVELEIEAIEVKTEDGTSSFIDFAQWLKINGSPDRPSV